MRNDVTTRHISGGNFQMKYGWKMKRLLGRIPSRLPTEDTKTAVAKVLGVVLASQSVQISSIGAYLAIGGARK